MLLYADKDWVSHDWIKNCAEVTTQKAPQLSRTDIAILVKVFGLMKFEDEQLWANLAAASNKMIHIMKARGFFNIFNHFLNNPTHCTSDFRERLIQLLPTRLEQMSADDMIQCFAILVKTNALNEYLWDRFFQRIFMERLHWFGPKNYCLIIDTLVGMNYKVQSCFIEAYIIT